MSPSSLIESRRRIFTLEGIEQITEHADIPTVFQFVAGIVSGTSPDARQHQWRQTTAEFEGD